mgnify:CR=1 FL=1
MKGIKTEVKTDWKNYVVGDSRGPLRIDKGSVYFKGFNQGDMIFISYHVKWKGVDWGKWTNSVCFQANNYLSWYGVGPANGGAESGEMDVVTGPWKSNTADWTHSNHKVTENDSLSFYSHVADGGIKVANDGYIELTNIMVGKGDRVQPYIDSDELKATGGATNKARIVALVLSEERRAA